ncbi:MAG: hypothetical protein QOE90_3436 [Thermoplasmata archaeon]|jgi:hypothetical protein|nr:hypothetical protein [Thermoplasmata archaeon]
MKTPVRVKPGWLQPELADQFPWRCAEHHAAGEEQCVKRCCGACYFLTPGSGCQLGPMRPVRCKTYPLVPMKDKVILHDRCPDAQHYLQRLNAKDPRALALLDVAVAMSDLANDPEADDNSEEVRWMVGYVEGGFRGTTLWKRKPTP